MFSRRSLAASQRLLGLSPDARCLFSALPAAASSSGGLFSSLLGGSKRTSVPMTDAFPGVAEPPVGELPKTAAKTEQTTMANGFRVASENSLGPTACAALVVDSGSIYESKANSGVSHILEHLAFKETTNRTHFRIWQEINGFGGNVLASAAREQMYYSIDCLRSDLPVALEVLCDSVLNPKFNPWDVTNATKVLKEDLENMKKNPQGTLGEVLTAASYSGGLSNPLVCPESSLGIIDSDVLHEFHMANYTAPRMALAVSGAEHQDVLRWVEPMLQSASSAGKVPTIPSTYVGGEVRIPGGDDLTHIILAFDSPGGWKSLKAAATMTVLLYMMGGGGSFSSGGPGKGMHSRLYLNVLTRHHWVQNFSAVNQAFDDRCLAGVYGAAPGNKAGELVDIMCKEMTAMTKTVNQEELDRAKAVAISQILMTLENKAVAAEDIGRQIITYGHRKPADEFVSEVNKVVAKDITQMVSEMLKSPPSMGSMGDLSRVPRYAEVSRRFG